MGERRLVDQNIFGCADLLPLGAAGRLLWVGMVVMCDRNGLIRADKSFLVNRILPGMRGKARDIDTVIAHLRHCSMIKETWKGDVKYYQLTNFKHYQRHKSRGTLIGLGRDDDDDGTGKQEGPAPSPPGEPPREPDADPEPSSAMQSASDFLDAELCPPAYQLPKLVDDLKRTGHTIKDVQVWRECLEWLRQHGTLKDPRSFIRSRFPKFRTPADAGIDWGDDAEPESGSPPPPTAEELERSDLLELCYANRRKIAATLGAPWDGADSGLTTTKGTYLWQDLKLTQLKNLAKKLGLNGNTQSL